MARSPTLQGEGKKEDMEKFSETHGQRTEGTNQPPLLHLWNHSSVNILKMLGY